MTSLNMPGFHWQSAVDFSAVAAAIYLLLRWSREARALRLALAVVGLWITALLAARLNLFLTAWVFSIATVVALVVLLVLFQAELRHALARLDIVGRLLPSRAAAKPAAIRSISQAAFSLGQARRGALIVIVLRDSVDQLISGGLPLGGEVSAEILEAIFRKVSPVHDGATIISGEHIARVSAVLPLTERADIPKGLGTRHRAALGLAERSDAAVIVVSEERGTVSLARGQVMDVIGNPEELARQLQQLQMRPRNIAKTKLKGLFFANPGLKAGALILAAAIWAVAYIVGGSSIRTITVPVEFSNLTRDFDVTDPSTNTVTVRLRGGTWVFESLHPEKIAVRFDLHETKEGVHAFRVQRSSLNLPPGLEVENVSPETVSVRIIRKSTP